MPGPRSRKRCTAAATGAWHALFENPFMVENGFGAAAGVPVMIDSRKYGALLVFDQAGRVFSDSDVNRLTDLAASFVEEANPDLMPAPTREDKTRPVSASPGDSDGRLQARPL